MSETAVEMIEFGSPRRTGDNWQYAVRPAERLDAADVEILTEPETPSGPDGQRDDD